MENAGRIFIGFLLGLVPITMLFGIAGAGMSHVTVGNSMFLALFACISGWLLFLKN